jgi:hypothetical protein
MRDTPYSEQLSVSTAEEEENYFTEETVVSPQAPSEAVLPPGTYRVIDGQLFRVLPGPPPLDPTAKEVRSSGNP